VATQSYTQHSVAPRVKRAYSVVLESTVGQRERWLVGTVSVVPAQTAASRIWRRVSCCVEELLPKQHAEEGRIKAICTLKLSPALLRELMALSRRNKKLVVPAGSRSTTSTAGARASQSSSSQLAGKRKPGKLGRVIRARQPAPSVWRWVRASARECICSHVRTTCCLQPATRASRGRGDVRGCFSRARPPFQPSGSLKPSHGFRPVRTRCLIRDRK
jgi:hypothetical protein